MEEKRSFKEFFCTNTGAVVLTAICYIVVFTIMAIIGGLSDILGDGPITNIIALVTFIAWGIWGWKGLSKIQPRIFLVMPIGGWAIYFLIKGALSLILGMFIAPYQIAKLIRKKLLGTL